MKVEIQKINGEDVAVVVPVATVPSDELLRLRGVALRIIDEQKETVASLEAALDILKIKY